MVENTPVEDVQLSDDIEMAQVSVELSEFGEQTAPKSDLLAQFGDVSGTGIEGRGSAMRGNMVGKYGGNEASEAAVARALKWLAEHQNPDGSWSFDHRVGPCQGRCNHQGSLAAANGATRTSMIAMAGDEIVMPENAMLMVHDPSGVVLGTAFGVSSPVSTQSDTLYVEVLLEPGQSVDIPEAEELAVYVVEGTVAVNDEFVDAGLLAVLHSGASGAVTAESAARIMFAGGAALGGKRYIWWNFVSSSRERIDRAKRDWREQRFDAVPGETDFTPLPER